MLRQLVTSAIALAVTLCASSAIGQGIPIGTQGSVPVCTYAQLHAGTCQLENAGYLATITDADPGDADACAAAGNGGVPGNQRTCRYNADTADWEEFEGGPGGGTDDQTAAEVSYDNATSGLTATDTQAAIDEIDAAVDGIGAGGGAPANAVYLTGSADATLSAEVVIDDLDALNTHLGSTIADGPHTVADGTLDDITALTCPATIPAESGIFVVSGTCTIVNNTLTLDAVGAISGGNAIRQRVINNTSILLIADDVMIPPSGSADIEQIGTDTVAITSGGGNSDIRFEQINLSGDLVLEPHQVDDTVILLGSDETSYLELPPISTAKLGERIQILVAHGLRAFVRPNAADNIRINGALLDPGVGIQTTGDDSANGANGAFLCLIHTNLDYWFACGEDNYRWEEVGGTTPSGHIFVRTDSATTAVDLETSETSNACASGEVLKSDGLGALACAAESLGVTNLGVSATGDVLDITSDTGSNAVIPQATTSTWGAMTDEDKTKLDGIDDLELWETQVLVLGYGDITLDADDVTGEQLDFISVNSSASDGTEAIILPAVNGSQFGERVHFTINSAVRAIIQPDATNSIVINGANQGAGVAIQTTGTATTGGSGATLCLVHRLTTLWHSCLGSSDVRWEPEGSADSDIGTTVFVDLDSNEVANTLRVQNGGTGGTTYTADALLFGDGTDPLVAAVMSGDGTMGSDGVLALAIGIARDADVTTLCFDGRIPTPTDSDDTIIPALPYALDVTSFSVAMAGTDTPLVTITIEECDSAGDNCDADDGISVAATGGIQTDTTFTDDGIISSGSAWNVNVSGTSGTVEYASWRLCGTAAVVR